MTAVKDPVFEWRQRNPIAVWRRKTGTTQRGVSERIGVALSKVAAWEHGAHFPSWENLVALADMMRRDPARLEYAFRRWTIDRPEEGGTHDR